jgi:hypothetical protein
VYINKYNNSKANKQRMECNICYESIIENDIKCNKCTFISHEECLIKCTRRVCPQCIQDYKITFPKLKYKGDTKLKLDRFDIHKLNDLYLYTNLIRLDISHCYAKQLPALPDSLEIFKCIDNKLTSLPTLPQSLQYLNCQRNLLTSLPDLPQTLEYLSCSVNQLTSLSASALPQTLTHLYCGINKLTSLPALPQTLTHLHFWNNNKLTSLPELPKDCIIIKIINSC